MQDCDAVSSVSTPVNSTIMIPSRALDGRQSPAKYTPIDPCKPFKVPESRLSR
jgi:hypothetical protein